MLRRVVICLLFSGHKTEPHIFKAMTYISGLKMMLDRGRIFKIINKLDTRWRTSYENGCKSRCLLPLTFSSSHFSLSFSAHAEYLVYFNNIFCLANSAFSENPLWSWLSNEFFDSGVLNCNCVVLSLDHNSSWLFVWIWCFLPLLCSTERSESLTLPRRESYNTALGFCCWVL